ncbi:ERF family protein [Oceanobacillus neutriphilus]|uniref:Recombinase n=1 Tax=Oceanobacillus neutriphilus TaxID=531815 RepID=A0ABQ2P3M6_9BACI|nr:ERF family protein [Oceanobacillus neutriphilus]GGP17271.1 recombinase [Oceanobacillus neutriphilus]
MSDETLVQKLIHVQKELKAPKGQFNEFGNYNYRSAEDILEAVKPFNAEKGLLLTLTDEPLLVGEWHYIKAAASITDGKDTHTVTAYARESESKKGMDHSQITGTASSYARKYALNGLYLIDDTKDADTDEYQNQNNQNSQPNNKNLSEAQVKRLFAIGKSVQVTAADIKKVIMNDYNKTDVSLLTKKEYDEVCSRLESKKRVLT